MIWKKLFPDFSSSTKAQENSLPTWSISTPLLNSSWSKRGRVSYTQRFLLKNNSSSLEIIIYNSIMMEIIFAIIFLLVLQEALLQNLGLIILPKTQSPVKSSLRFLRKDLLVLPSMRNNLFPSSSKVKNTSEASIQKGLPRKRLLITAEEIFLDPTLTNTN